jgi:hypothetical protein
MLARLASAVRSLDARGIDTNGLTEVLVLPLGPLRAKAGEWALEPDDAALPRVATLYVSANYFSTFGVSLARGPGFDPAIDDAPSAEPRLVLSHDFWRSRAASDPDIVGQSVTIEGVPHVVVWKR